MILGRTPGGAIKTKSDGGLRAVNCACCGPRICPFNDGDIVTISALGKSSTITIYNDTGQCVGIDIGHQEGLTNFTQYNRAVQPGSEETGQPCVAGPTESSFPSDVYQFTWAYSINGYACEIYFIEESNISDVYVGPGYDFCDESGNFPPGCCVCNNSYETQTVTKSRYITFPITGYGTYNVNIPTSEQHYPFCNAYTVNLTTLISVVLS
jgi:hypothetical protein